MLLLTQTTAIKLKSSKNHIQPLTRLKLMPNKKFKLNARISSENSSAIKPVIEQVIGKAGSIKPTADGFEVQAELEGTSARDLNRTLLSELRRAEKKTRLRAEWTCDGTIEKFFDYAQKSQSNTKES